MLNLEVDGTPVQVPSGSMVMDATHKLGLYVPHFCWHNKLSIAANCRMCLVQVEKAPKPLPACATPVTEGMKVWTHSEAAVGAQKGVMEFLLINHPLDCPICDQGGECQLQDLAVGYGASSSRYNEPKRVVFNKNLGPLIATDMTRCIHCTRCVRFGQEIAGVMELGMIGRGEHAEIITFIGKTVDSELSGNMIDLCPVGALTSKPFRYSARTWELVRRKSISPHDGLGSNLVVQVMGERVMRVVPQENDAINECWLSDKDRFSYEGLNSEERLTAPMIRKDGRLQETDWQTALEFVAAGLMRVRDEQGAGAIGALASPHSTLEELYLAQKLVRGLGSDNIDFRLRHCDADADSGDPGAPWLGMPIAAISKLDRALVVGSFLRKDHPLIAERLRQVAKRGAQVSLLHVADDEMLFPVANKAIVAPSALPRALAEIVVAASRAAGTPLPPALAGIEPTDAAAAIAASLMSGTSKAILLGNLARQHPRASQLHALALLLSDCTGAIAGFLTEAANSVGGYLARALPRNAGLSAARMIASPRKAFLLLHAEPEFDCADARSARAAMEASDFVVALSPFRHGATEYADALLPVSPFTETAGTFVNCEGLAQSFNGVALPLGQTRPAWKVLRVLGSLLGLSGFEYDDAEAIRIDAIGNDPAAMARRLSNRSLVAVAPPAKAGNGTLERIADVPIYAADPLVRRAVSLQKTADARKPLLRLNAATAAMLHVTGGGAVRVRQGNGEAMLNAAIDEGVPDRCVRIAAAHAATATLGPMFGAIAVDPL